MSEEVLIVKILSLLWLAKVSKVVLFLFVHCLFLLLVGGEVALPVDVRLGS